MCDRFLSPEAVETDRETIPKRIFGVPPVVLLSQMGVPLPPTITLAMEHLKRFACDSVGLFRKPGVQSRIQQLQNEMELDPGWYCFILPSLIRRSGATRHSTSIGSGMTNVPCNFFMSSCAKNLFCAIFYQDLSVFETICMKYVQMHFWKEHSSFLECAHLTTCVRERAHSLKGTLGMTDFCNVIIHHCSV